MTPTRVPTARLVRANGAPLRPERPFVLYWMIAARRLRSNFALERAVEHARALDKPLVVLEALRVGYEHASERLHRFVLDGMAEHAHEAASTRALYHPYVEASPGEGKGLLEALAAHAAVVVTDDFPSFFLPRMVRAAADTLDVALEAVDGNGLLPMRAVQGDHASAYAFRREMQKLLPAQLDAFPRARPLDDLPERPQPTLPAAIVARWRARTEAELRDPSLVARLPIDHGVPPVATKGGAAAARSRLDAFVRQALPRYEERAHPDEHVGSGLSPYLHFGHLGAHEIFRAVVPAGWKPRKLAPNGGKREGYFGMDAAREAFLDQLVTWRELGFAYALRHPDHARYESLPAWARATLDAHRHDGRPLVYDEATLAAARTGDPVWNAAQRELLGTGTIQNYLRMLWGKKILLWTASPEEAFSTMVRLNDRYALDGRDPNSYSGIGWVLGRFDRPWAPERPVYGQIRYMTSESAVRKLRMKAYLARWGEGTQPSLPGWGGGGSRP